MHAPVEEKSDNLKHRFYEELDQVSEHFLDPVLVWWGFTNPSHIFCYAIMVFANTVFFPPVYLHLI
jgi:hypothetical protein